jgi:phenylacetate-CoA ligase
MDPRRTLAARIVDPLVWTVLKRLPVLSRVSEWRESQWDDVPSFRARHERALTEILNHSLARLPYYRDAVRGLAPEDVAADPAAALSAFPVLEKRDLAAHADALTCDTGRGAFWNTTGGSTGEPARFLQDRVFQTNALATTMLMYEWAGVPRGSRHMKLWGAPRDLGSGRVAARRRVWDWLSNRTTLDAFNMSELTMRSYAERISASRPVCLEGYSDALYELATLVQRLGLEMDPPGAIVSSAGTLLPHMRETIERSFGAAVFDRYGTREVGNVAAECDRHDGLHVFGETVIVEVVDADGRSVGVDEEGEMLVTTLTNYTMPLIRYRIGDRAVRGADRCSCGRPYPLLARVLGRSESSVVRPDGGVVLPEFFIHVIGVEYNDGSIAKFQVVQESASRLTIVIVPFEGAGEKALAHADAIRARIRQVMGDCEIEFVLAERIDPTPTGKHLYVINRMERGGRMERGDGMDRNDRMDRGERMESGG